MLLSSPAHPLDIVIHGCCGASPVEIGQCDDLTQAFAGRTRLSIPLLDFPCELIAKVLQLSYALVDGRQMLVSQREDVFTGRPAGTRKLQDLGDLLERKTQGLRLPDERQFLDGFDGVSSVSGVRTRRRAQESEAFVIPDSRGRNSRPFRQLADQESGHASVQHLQVDLKVKNLFSP